ncbi:hypothetical protein LZ31DRAFT_549968 [Colletotrichum somersetense]|nr:hypothetical protein LZ31DRAFT_549968 [Colletotrichum somersetense]
MLIVPHACLNLGRNQSLDTEMCNATPFSPSPGPLSRLQSRPFSEFHAGGVPQRDPRSGYLMSGEICMAIGRGVKHISRPVQAVKARRDRPLLPPTLGGRSCSDKKEQPERREGASWVSYRSRSRMLVISRVRSLCSYGYGKDAKYVLQTATISEWHGHAERRGVASSRDCRGL